MRPLTRPVVGIAVAAIATAWGTSSALAHIDPDPKEAPAGSEQSVGLHRRARVRRIGHDPTRHAAPRRRHQRGPGTARRLDGQCRPPRRHVRRWPPARRRRGHVPGPHDPAGDTGHDDLLPVRAALRAGRDPLDRRPVGRVRHRARRAGTGDGPHRAPADHDDDRAAHHHGAAHHDHDTADDDGTPTTADRRRRTGDDSDPPRATSSTAAATSLPIDTGTIVPSSVAAGDG